MKIQLKRSNVLSSGAAKVPTASQLEYGELAVNYNTSDPAIFLKDSNNNIIRISGVGNISDDGLANVPDGTTPPANPEAGNLWYNSDQGRLYIYFTDADSSQWVDASPDSWDPSSYPDTANSSAQANTLDDRYVMVNGGNGLKIDSSGNVGLGTIAPNNYSNYTTLTLNDSTGSELDLEVGQTLTGQLYAQSNLMSVDARGTSTDLRFRTNLTERMRINTSGGIDFLGAVASGYTTGALIFSGGRIASYISNSTTGTDPRIYVYNGNTTSYLARINADGSATFGSTLTVGGAALNGAAAGVQLYPTGGIHATQASGSSTILSGYTQGSSTKNVAIKANGSAVFGQAPNNSNATGVGILDAGGAIAVQANGKLFRGHAYSNGAETSAITDAGAATFRGNFVNGTATDYVGTYVNTNNGTILYGVDANVETWRISGDGGTFQFGGSTNYLKHTAADGLYRVTSGTTEWNLAANGDLTVGAYSVSPYLSGAKIFVNNSGGSSLIMNGNGSNGTSIGVYNGNASGYTAKILRNGDLYCANFKAHVFTSSNNGVVRLFNSSGAQKIQLIGTDGSAQFEGSITVGGTAAANTIDEYEEGTWQPVLTTNSGSNLPSYSVTANRSYYRRIGDLVFWNIDFDMNITSANTGTILKLSLPFTPASHSGLSLYGAGPSGRANSAFSVPNHLIAWYYHTGGLFLYKQNSTTGGEDRDLRGSDIDSGNSKRINISGFYYPS